MTLESRIRNAVQEKFSIHEIKLLKNTNTVQRLRVIYFDKATKTKGSLKIEVSFRDQPEEQAITVKNGIRVFSLEKLLSQKVSAFFNRTAARDLFDINFILTKTHCKPDDFSINRLSESLKTTAQLDETISRFKEAFELDSILQHHDCKNLVISIRNTIR